MSSRLRAASSPLRPLFPAAGNGAPAGLPATGSAAVARLGGRLAAQDVHRLLLVLAALSLFGGGFNAWTSIVQLVPVGVGAVFVLGCSLLAVIGAVAARSDRALIAIDYAVLTLGVLTIGIWSASHLYFNPAYGTDEAAYVQYAAGLLTHGTNPYTHSMLPGLSEFHVPIQYATYTLDGGISSQLAYPALPVLLTVPFIWLTHGVQSVIVANVVFLALGTIVGFLVLPRALRPLSVLVMVGLPILFGYTMSGMNDLLLLPFLLVVAYRWIEVGRAGGLGRRGIVQAAALGCALSVKPLAWFIAPFIVLGIWQARAHDRGARQAARIVGNYAAVALAVALLINGPFIVWAPRAWLDGVLSPLLQQVVPYGQGIVDASLFFHLGGGNIAAYTSGALFLYIAALFAQVRFFPTLGRAAFVVPAFVLFFPARSLAAYFMTLLPVWIVALVTCDHPPFAAARLRGLLPRRLLAAGLALALCGSVSFIGVAVAAPAPLLVQIEGASTNGQLQGVWQLKVFVLNRSHHTLTPHFATNSFGQVTSFWHPIRGPRELAPGAGAHYVLDAPNIGSMPGITTPFLLQAVTGHPTTISSSRLYTPQPFSAYLIPNYVNSVLHRGDQITFRVQLRSPYGAAVHKAGVRVALGQVVYGQNNLIPAQARINHGNTGESPVFAYTGEHGIAIFRVTDTEAENGNAVYLQTWIAPTSGYPYGYSDIVSVLWRP